jgi:hypothetical protein
MDWQEFHFGDYQDPSVRENLALIGEIVSISNFIDEQLRQIFHEILYNHYFDVAAIVFENIKNIDQKQKILKRMAERTLNEILQSELKSVLAKIKEISEKRNSVAHSMLVPKNDLTQSGSREYLMLKAAVPYYEQKLKINELPLISESLMACAREVSDLKYKITFYMKTNGRNSVK